MSNLSLRTLKSYLMQREQVTLTDLANHFCSEPDLVKSMLQHWVQKNKVVHIQLSACKKGCCCQNNQDLNLYRWISDGVKSIPIINSCH